MSIVAVALIFLCGWLWASLGIAGYLYVDYYLGDLKIKASLVITVAIAGPMIALRAVIAAFEKANAARKAQDAARAKETE